MMVLAAAEGTRIHQTLWIGVKFEDDEGRSDSLKAQRGYEWIDSSLASKLSSRVTAGYRTAE